MHIALHSQMGRACGLAWRRSGCIAVDLGILTIMRIPVVSRPLCLIRQQCLWIHKRTAILVAQLLAKLGSAYRTYLYALAAGNTLVMIHMGTVRTPAHIRRIVQLACTDRIAHTRCTIAQTDNLVLAINIGCLMHKAMTFTAFNDLQRFFLGNVMASARIHAPFGQIT